METVQKMNALALAMQMQIQSREPGRGPGPALKYPAWWRSNFWGGQERVVKRNKLNLSKEESYQMNQLTKKGKKEFLKVIHQNPHLYARAK